MVHKVVVGITPPDRFHHSAVVHQGSMYGEQAYENLPQDVFLICHVSAAKSLGAITASAKQMTFWSTDLGLVIALACKRALSHAIIGTWSIVRTSGRAPSPRWGHRAVRETAGFNSGMYLPVVGGL